MLEQESKLNRSYVKWLLIFGLWTVVALFFTSQVAMQSRLSQRPISFFRILSWQLSSSYVWFALMPLILWLGRKFRFENGKWKTSLPIHFVASLIVALGQQAMDALILPKLGYPPNIKFSSYLDGYRVFLLINFHLSVSIYWAVIGIKYAIGYYQKYRERELRASQLEARLAQTRLQVLKMQLHPHFLFNTLNAISELVYKDPEAAEQMITNLSDLLRLSLDNVGVQEVPLQQELEFLNKYIEIEQTRFHDRLQVELHIEPDTLDASVPNMILQPLVENAIKHGIAPRSSGGRVEIDAERQNGLLLLRVSDDGIGLSNGDGETLKEGVGLSNTRARLRHLYGEQHRFELKPLKDGGLMLQLEIPFKSSNEN
jgi:two-component sensor histidine kinase